MNSAIRIGLMTIAVFFGGIGSWSALAPLNSAVIAAGVLRVRGNRKTVQHRQGGIVAQLLVQEGSKVKQGQVLIRLDDTQAMAAFHVHQSELLADEALSARDLAELSGATTIAFPKDLLPTDPVAATIMRRERVVFRNHRDLLQRELAVVDQRVAQAREQEAGARKQLQSGERELALAEQEQAALLQLEKIGLAAKNRVLELSRNVEALRGQVGELSADVARFGSQAVELQAEKLRLRQSAQSDATRELREAQLRINDVLPRLAADRDMLKRLDIRAPISGTVVNLSIFTKGGVVEPGRPLMDIVPSNATLVAEARVQPQDVEHLRVGESVQVLATGFDTRVNPPIQGRIRMISADRVTDPRTGRSFFKADIALMSDHQGGKLLRRLGPGMPIEMVATVTPRTVLQYLIGPLRSSFRKAGREL